MRILVDTGILIALMVPSETHHKVVSKKTLELQNAGHSFHVTDYVVDEFLTRMLYDGGSKTAEKALITLQDLFDDRSLILSPIHLDIFNKSFDKYKSLLKQGLSFTDVTTWVMYSEGDYDDLMTLDGDFRKLGLKVGV